MPSCTMNISPGTGFAPLTTTASLFVATGAGLRDIDRQDGTVNVSLTHTYVTTGSFLVTATVENIQNDALIATCSDLVQVSTDCGNGLVEIGEQCDDANDVDGDGCSTSCRDEYCGDAVINNNGNESCDDGNTSNNDSCTTACEQAVCGDGYVRNGI